MATQIWVNNGSGNVLLPDSTKPLTLTLTYADLSSSNVSCVSHLKVILQEMLDILIHIMCSHCSEITLLKSLNRLGANELTRR